MVDSVSASAQLIGRNTPQTALPVVPFPAVVVVQPATKSVAVSALASFIAAITDIFCTGVLPFLCTLESSGCALC
jgi:hypothetical protein